MATANSGLQITNLDFYGIKNSLKAFLKQQDTLKDYNFDASGLNVLIDLLTYNTQYNAYYLNMAANEMFLDSAVLRNSVVSHAKLLGYTPRSVVAPSATAKITVNNVGQSSLTLPKNTYFLSEPIDGVNYTFVTTEDYTVNTSANTAVFEVVELSQGIPASYSFTVDKSENPKLVFDIPDANVDTSTIVVTVQESSSNLFSETYTRAEDFVNLTPASKVYFLQESMNGLYQVYFGDGILGKTLNNDNIVNISALSSQGSAATGANNFVVMDPIDGYSNVIVTPITAAFSGADRESINSIKFSAPKAYSAQGRAVTKEDYVYLIQRNSSNIPIDSVSVWGGEENNPPVYGQLFCAIKPTGGFTLTPSQKERLVEEVIKPISVITVEPTIVDPDYTYVKLNTKVLYDPRKTSLTASQIETAVRNNILAFSRSTLNTFNSTFKLPELITNIQLADSSIVTNDTSLRIQKKFYPALNTKTTLTFDFGVPLKRNYFNAGLSSYPTFSTRDANSGNAIRSGVYFEELPAVVGGIASINVQNPGFGYSRTPIVRIVGDGKDATAIAVLNAGRVSNIVVTNPGYNYTQAIVTITPAEGDTSGALAFAVPVLEGSIGKLRTYYYQNNIKTVLDADAGSIDYINGKVTLKDFLPTSIDNELGQLTISVTPESNIISSTFNKIVALDEFDPDSITLSVIATQQ